MVLLCGRTDHTHPIGMLSVLALVHASAPIHGAALIHEAAPTVATHKPVAHKPVAIERHRKPYTLFSLGENRTFYSLHEQDRQLIETYPHWLTHLEGKTLLEMGALDGITVSNTKFFHDLGWRGVLVEPQDACREQIALHRPEDVVFANASCADFTSFPLEQVPGQCIGGVGGDQFLTTERKTNTPGLKTSQVGCSPIGHMLKVANVTKLDLWSLDVEGAELEVLRGMDWAHIPVHTLLIEMLPGNNPKGEAGLEEIRALLRANGMRFVKKMGTAGWDELWEDPTWYERMKA